MLPQCLKEDLVNAWGRGGPWTEDSGSVYAPEEVRKQQNLFLLMKKSVYEDKIKDNIEEESEYQHY